MKIQGRYTPPLPTPMCLHQQGGIKPEQTFCEQGERSIFYDFVWTAPKKITIGFGK